MSTLLMSRVAPARVKVAAIGPHSAHAPSFAVRILGPRASLADFGVDVQPLTLFSESEEKEFQQGLPWRKWKTASSARKRLFEQVDVLDSETDCVWIQRRADVFRSRTIERRAIEGRRLVYDVDDAIWIEGRAANGSILAFAKGARRKAEWLAQHADHVLAGNEYLAEHLSRFARRVTVLPSLVDLSEYPERRHDQTDTLTIGWIGSRTTAPYLASVTPALRRVSTQIEPRRLLLLIVGGTPPPTDLDHEVLPWTPQNQRLALERMDVGIMPQPRRPWVLGKCGYKALQYMAAGIPVVANDVGVAAHTIGDAGSVTSSEDEWVEALLTLAGDVRLRKTLGAAGRARVSQHYSLERWLPTLAGVLRGETE